MRRITLGLAAVAALALPSLAQAHPKLVSATPAAEATVPKPTELKLTFSEALVGPLSGIDLAMTGMPGMANHAPTQIAHTSAMSQDGKTMTLTPRRVLARGTYRVTWSAAGSDTHRMGSNFSFTVR